MCILKAHILICLTFSMTANCRVNSTPKGYLGNRNGSFFSQCVCNPLLMPVFWFIVCKVQFMTFHRVCNKKNKTKRQKKQKKKNHAHVKMY